MQERLIGGYWCVKKALQDGTIHSISHADAERLPDYSGYLIEELQQLSIPTTLDASLGVKTEHLIEAKVTNLPNIITLEESLEFLLSHDHGLVIYLDGLTYDRNIGQILRTAAFFTDIPVVIMSESQITNPAVCIHSSGAAMTVRLCEEQKLDSLLQTVSKYDFEILVADIGQDARPLHEHSFSSRTCLILGNEKNGPSQIAKNLAHCSIYIPGGDPELDSLNVSSAASIILYEYQQQFKK